MTTVETCTRTGTITVGYGACMYILCVCTILPGGLATLVLAMNGQLDREEYAIIL